MEPREYLVSYGTSGDFARFRPLNTVTVHRGDRVVVRGPNGLEMGVVLCEATEGHSRFLSRTALGELVRPASEMDEKTLETTRERGHRLFEECRHLATQMGLPMEIIDVEVLLDGQQAIISFLKSHDCDYRPLVSTLSKKHDIFIIMQNLTLPKEPETGCGKPDCGKAEGGGGCSSCGTGGGCSTCSSGAKKEDVGAYLTGLRDKMEKVSRIPLH